MHDMRDRAAPSRSTAGDDAHATPGKHTRVAAIPHEPGASASSAHPVQRKATADHGDGHAAQHGAGGAAGPHGATIHSLFGRNHGDPGAHDDAALDAADEHDADADDGDGDAPANVALKAGRPPGAKAATESGGGVATASSGKPKGAVQRASTGAAPQAEAARAKHHRPLTIEQATARYAPLVFLAPGETHRPSDASQYIKNSRLRWSHDSGQSDDEIADKGHIDEKRLGDGGYSDQVQDLLGRKHGDPIHSNQDVRPKDGKGDGGNEGFFLDLDNAHHESTGPGTNMPVYFEAVAGHYITFWFFYAYNEGPAPGGIDNHEGDWERISIKLNRHNRATAVAYYQHNGHEVKRWREVPKQGSHPLVFSAKGSHASYDSPGAKDLGVPFGLVKDQAGRGAQWKTWKHMKNARAQDWYGYGGAWGEVGNYKDTTGPQGPSRYKPPAPEGW
jgi:hypothetical protein